MAAAPAHIDVQRFELVELGLCKIVLKNKEGSIYPGGEPAHLFTPLCVEEFSFTIFWDISILLLGRAKGGTRCVV